MIDDSQRMMNVLALCFIFPSAFTSDDVFFFVFFAYTQLTTVKKKLRSKYLYGACVCMCVCVCLRKNAAEAPKR